MNFIIKLENPDINCIAVRPAKRKKLPGVWKGQAEQLPGNGRRSYGSTFLPANQKQELIHHPPSVQLAS